MISLGGIELSEHLVLSGLLSSPQVASSARYTLGGRPVVQRTALSGGRALVLQGTNHFTLGELKEIKLLEEAAQPVELIHPLYTGEVLITGITSPEPIFERSDPEDDWFYSAEINLQEL